MEPEHNMILQVKDKSMIENNKVLEKILYGVFEHIDIDDNLSKYGRIQKIFPNNFINKNSYSMIDYFRDNYSSDVCNSRLFNEYMILLNSSCYNNLVGGDFKRNIHDKQINNDKLKRIIKLFSLKNNKIKLEHIPFYYTKIRSQYRPKEISQMVGEIKEYDYLQPLKILNYYYEGNNYYGKILNKYQNISFERNMLNFNKNISQKDIDFIALQYIKSRKDICCLTLLNTSFFEIKKIIKTLEKDVNIYHTKKVVLSKNAVMNLLFVLFDDYLYNKRIDKINHKLKRMGVGEKNTHDEQYEIVFIFYENNKDIKHINNHITEKLMLNDNTKYDSDLKIIKLEDIIHFSNSFYQVVNIAQTILNKNSIKILEIINLDIYRNEFMFRSHLKLETLKKILFRNYSLIELDRIMIYDISSFLNGFKNITNFNGFISDIPDTRKEIIKFTENNFMIKNDKIPFININYETSELLKNNWHDKIDEIFTIMNIDNMIQHTTNPKYFYYYNFIKFSTFKLKIFKKLNRNSVSDHIDFLMLNLLDKNIISEYIVINNKKNRNNKQYKNYHKSGFFLINKDYCFMLGKIDLRRSNERIKILKNKYPEQIINKIQHKKDYIKYFSQST
jgi:hypothetical protein